MNYDEWLKTVPVQLTGDPLWRVEAYRLSVFAGDLSWHDVTKLASDKRTLGLVDQLYRSVGAVSSDICEGYSRKSHKDQARFYEYALGSARESRNWYYRGRFILGEQVAIHRMEFLTSVIRLLLTMIPNERAFQLREEPVEYGAALSADLLNAPLP